MTTPDYKALCAEMADALDHNRQCLMDDRSLTHPLADRARAALAEEAVGLSDESLIGAATESGLCYPQCWDFSSQPEQLEHLRAFARAVLARYGSTPPRPVPVAERPWEREGWCDEQGRCWWTQGTVKKFPAGWWLVSTPHVYTSGFMLPAHAIPTPENTDD